MNRLDQRIDNVYVVTRTGMVEKVVQVRTGETHDIPSLKGIHIAEAIHDPLVTNHVVNQIRRTLDTGWPTEVLFPVRLTDIIELRIATIEKMSTDRVLMFVHPAE